MSEKKKKKEKANELERISSAPLIENEHHSGNPKAKKNKREKRLREETEEMPSIKRSKAASKKGDNFADMFDGELDNEVLTINKSFVNKFQAENEALEKAREESQLNRIAHAMIRDKDSDSDSEEEDDDGILLTEEYDKKIEDTIQAIRKKDPNIYKVKEEDNIFNQLESDIPESKSRKSKKLTVTGMLRKQVLEGEEDSDENTDGPRTIAQETKALKNAFLREAAKEDAEDDGDDGGSFLQLRPKDPANAKDDADTEALPLASATSKKAKKNKNKKNDDEEITTNPADADAFLRDFFTKQWWREKDAKKLPTYSQIVGEQEPTMPDISSDEDYLENQEEFEAKHNFRFEEEGANHIMTYPRQIDDSVRNTTSKRKEQREAKKKRKEEELQLKAEKLKQLKNLKKKEILDRLAKIQETSGASVDGFDGLDLSAQFDPAEHDRQMESLFNDDFYAGEEALPEDDMLQVVMEGEQAEFDKPLRFQEELDAKIKKAQKKKQKTAASKLAPNTNQSGALSEDAEASADHDPSNSTNAETQAMLDKAMDEYYALDYEDMIGDLPVRFKYNMHAKPLSFGLSIEDILNMDEKELNQRVSIKKLAPYKDVEDVPWSEGAHNVPGVPQGPRSKTFQLAARRGGHGSTKGYGNKHLHTQTSTRGRGHFSKKFPSSGGGRGSGGRFGGGHGRGNG